MKNTKVIAGILTGCIAAGAAAEIRTVQIGQVRMNLDTSTEYCLLDEKAHEFDRHILESQRLLTRGTSMLLAYSVPCEELETLRASNVEMTRYAILQLPAKEEPPKRRPNVTRAAAIAFFKSLLGQMQQDKATFEEGIRKVEERVKTMTPGKLSLGVPEFLGVVTEDENAVYGAALMKIESTIGDRPTDVPMVMVTGYSLVNQYLVVYSLYRDYEGEKTIKEATEKMKEMMARLVRANS